MSNLALVDDFQNPPISLGCLGTDYLHRISSMYPLFSQQGNGGQNVTRHGGPRIGVCFILSDLLSVQKIAIAGKSLFFSNRQVHRT